MPVCLRSQPSCHASLKFVGYSNLLNGDILKMSKLKLSQPGVFWDSSLEFGSSCLVLINWVHVTTINFATFW